MQIYINKNGQQLGPFEESAVLQMFNSGQLSQNDLGIKHGGNQWSSLKDMFPNVVQVATPNPPVKSSGRRTTRQFNYHGNLWYAVDKWAYESGYKQIQANGNERLYKFSSMMVSMGMLKISYQNQEVYLESWVGMSFFTRFRTFFIMPAEVGIGSGSLVAAVPKGIVRKQINLLLNQLGQPPIA
jgi:hypothetical protein